MAGSFALQHAVFNALNSDSALSALIDGIYDNQEQISNPESDASFPVLTISTGTILPWDDDTKLGGQADVEIHTWSRARNALQAKQIMDAVYNVLHRGTLTISGWLYVDCDMIDQINPQRDPDGITRHGVQTFRITYEEA